MFHDCLDGIMCLIIVETDFYNLHSQVQKLIWSALNVCVLRTNFVIQ